MGTDIHPYAEHKLDGETWKRMIVSIPRYRNYAAFALLANVRNGFGFAGVPTHEAVVPIAEPRGFPPDTSLKDNSDSENIDWRGPNYISFGYHDFSWVTLEELKRINFDAPLTEQGYVDPETAVKLDTGEIKVPKSWCGGTSDRTWVSRQWKRPVGESASLLVEWIARLEEWKQDNWYNHYKEADGLIRVVFGFDS